MKEQVRPVQIVPKVIIEVKESLTEVHCRKVNLRSKIAKKLVWTSFYIKKYLRMQVFFYANFRHCEGQKA